VLYSELIIFIGYENNEYCFICHTQGNIIFHSIYTIFDKELFPQCTNSHVKECKLYNELLDKTSLETELLAPNPSEKDGPALVLIPHTSISPIQDNPLIYFLSPSFFYKSTFFPSTLGSKKPTVEIEETNDVDSNVEMQLSSPQ